MGILTTAINSGQTVDSIAPFVSRGGGAEGLDAVPSECVNGFSRFDEADVYAAIDRLENDLQNNIITQAEYDTELAEQQAIIANDPCVWEFEQGEDLFTWGAFNLYFNNPEVNYDVSWNIIGQGKTWDNLAGTINTDPALVDPSDPGAAIEFGSVMLNMAAPVDLLPGIIKLTLKLVCRQLTVSFSTPQIKPTMKLKYKSYVLITHSMGLG
ncbi:hypothetical protein [Psychrosphaera algicola]|uniref:Uncharacterized protein n=1 Tax=Psychrosphaera algicola TaxID=3023714 RepID=A0ABT5FIW4_9GAMM|nr:hypothetical protein [Psychrosphaera sp. G1-22]MDC2891126.1 hypothetical protein [Psychrosphaera sp. G1-22]